MLIYDLFGMSIGALVIWGFLMAVLLHSFFYVIKVKRNLQLLITSSLLFFSYYTSDFFVLTGGYQAYIYGVFALFDLLTLALILIVSRVFFKNQKIQVGVLYVIYGLAINTLLFSAMYVDTVVYENSTRWFLWYVYSYTVISVDFIMVAALLLNKDFLRIRYTVNRMMAPS